MRKTFTLIFLCFTSLVYGKAYNDSISLYKYGDAALLKHFGLHLRYLDQSAIGVTILSWNIENGEIQDIAILNSLGSTMDKEILRVLKLTEGNWISIDSAVQFYLPIKLKSNSLDYFIDEYPDFFLREIMMVSYGSNKKLQTDEALITKLNSELSNKSNKKVLSTLNELLSRNPFSEQLRNTKIYCSNQLGDYKSACEDVEFMVKHLGITPKYPCIMNK